MARLTMTTSLRGGWWLLGAVCGLACGTDAPATEVESPQMHAAAAPMQATAGTPAQAAPSATQASRAGAPASTAGSAAAAPAAPAGPLAAAGASAEATDAAMQPTAGVSGSAAPTAGSAGSAPVAEAPSCPTTEAPRSGNQTRMVPSNDRMRSYLLYVPQSYTGMAPVPVVFDFHGYSSSAQGQLGASGFRELADQEGFIAVYPEGVGASWHVNGCCGQAQQEGLDEIEFVRAIWDDVRKVACIDPKRVFASGISQGGGMAHHVGCLAADIFAGVAPVSSDIRTDPCMPSRPITEISFRGTADSLSPYEGGHVGPAGMDGYEAIGAKNTLEKWKTINMCTGTPVMMNDICETYTTCAGGSAVSLCSLPGANHILYQNASSLSVPKVAWELFTQHPQP